MKASAQRRYTFWQEETYDELNDAPKLTRARVTNVFEGDIEGESWEEYMIMYRSDNTSSFVSLERVIGRVGGLSGSFVVHGIGTYQDGIARGTLTIVAGSGTGDLSGLRGEGEFVAHKGQASQVVLTYEVAELVKF